MDRMFLITCFNCSIEFLGVFGVIKMNAIVVHSLHFNVENANRHDEHTYLMNIVLIREVG